jgi:hypothetical protein
VDASLVEVVDGGTGDSPSMIGLDGGPLGDGSCPSDLARGFVAGTETCGSLAAVDAFHYVCPGISSPGIWLECRDWLENDGAHILLGWQQVPMGSFVCRAQLLAVADGLYCMAVQGTAEAGYSFFAIGGLVNTDGDGIFDVIDNCPTVSNIDQTDSDHDGVGNACDNCPYTYNPDQAAPSDGGAGNGCNCALPGVAVDRGGCFCVEGGVGSPAGSPCGLVVLPDGGVASGG